MYNLYYCKYFFKNKSIYTISIVNKTKQINKQTKSINQIKQKKKKNIYIYI